MRGFWAAVAGLYIVARHPCDAEIDWSKTGEGHAPETWLREHVRHGERHVGRGRARLAAYAGGLVRAALVVGGPEVRGDVAAGPGTDIGAANVDGGVGEVRELVGVWGGG